MKLVFASHNRHKLEEISFMLRRDAAEGISEPVDLTLCRDLGITEDIPETSDTLEGNALQKAHYVYDRFHCDCFADDTGLEVEALNGAPGVYTARFAGEACSFEQNVDKILRVMEGETNRKARFRTVIALILNGQEYLFEGAIDGFITTGRRGTGGFGYDPVFEAEGTGLTFSEMGPETKNRLSHRARAIEKFVAFLRENAK